MGHFSDQEISTIVVDVFCLGGQKILVGYLLHHRPANILGFFGGKKNIKFSLPLPPTKHCTR